MQTNLKKKVDIKNLVISLERPASNEKMDELNIILGKYLDSVEEPLNMSFWSSVRYDYWSFINLTKLCDKTYDVREDDFVSKIRQMVRDRIIRDPYIRPAYVAPVPIPRAIVAPVSPSVKTLRRSKSPERTPLLAEQCERNEYNEAEDNVDAPPLPNKNIPWYKRWGNKIAIALGLSVVFVGYKYYTRNEK